MSKCGRLGRCVLAATLCDRYRASLHVVLALLVSHPCLVSRLGCHIVWQLSAADFKHPCLKPLGVHFIRHPCLTRTVRVRPPAPKKAGLCLFVITKCGGAGLSKCACSVGFASCETLCKHYHASLRLRSFGSLHRAATLCDRYRASFARL